MWYAWEGWKELDLSNAAKWDSEEWKTFSGMLIGFIFAPISLAVILLAYAFSRYEDKKNARRSKIIYDWENQAALLANTDTFSLRSDKDLYNSHMREAAGVISQNDLKEIANSERENRYFNQDIVNAALDELFERALLKGNK